MKFKLLLVIILSSTFSLKIVAQNEKAVFKKTLRDTIETSLFESESYSKSKGMKINPKVFALEKFDLNFELPDKEIPERHKQLLLERINSYLKNRLQFNEKSKVQHDEFIPNVLNGFFSDLRTALNNEEIIPTNERRDLILSQSNELRFVAESVILDLFNEFNQEVVKESIKAILDRNLTMIDDPLDRRLKRVLSANEVTKIHKAWSEIDLSHPNVPPPLKISSENAVIAQLRMQAIIVASLFQEKWTEAFYNSKEEE